MKRLLVFVFSVTLLGSCSKEREIYLKFKILTNSSNLTHISFSYEQFLNSARGVCLFNDTSGVAVGSTCTTETNTFSKGAGINVWSYNPCDQPNAIFDFEAEFYVNGNLEETARGGTTSEIVTFIVP